MLGIHCLSKQLIQFPQELDTAAANRIQFNSVSSQNIRHVPTAQAMGPKTSGDITAREKKQARDRRLSTGAVRS